MDWTRLPLARAAVDRAAHRRSDPDLLARALGSPSTGVVLVRDGRLATRTDDGALALDTRAAPALVEALTGLVDPWPLWFFLGEDDDGAAHLAAVLPGTPDDAGVDLEGVARDPLAGLGRLEWSTLRDLGHRLPDRDAGLASTAVALAAWHERHPRCPRCGEPTRPADAGWTRRCVADGSDHYPRTDPAVIMAVTDDDDRLLLGHAAHWPARRFSTLAGFVEPGESLEAAVRREVAEEVGVTVGDVTYRGSQPWPFPASLMLAFTAHATTTDVTVDGVELVDARWFTRAALAEAVAAGEVLLPMRTSVARALVEDWFGGPVDVPGEW